MADTNLQVRDAAGAVKELKRKGSGTAEDPYIVVVDVLARGAAAAAASLPVAFSTEDRAALDGMSGKLPASLGTKSVAASLATTQAANTGLDNAAVSVGATPVALTASLANRRSMTIFNNGTATVYVGASDVSAVNGIPVGVGQSFSLDLGANITIYGYCATAGQDVRVLEVS